jgi:hypothetical protein
VILRQTNKDTLSARSVIRVCNTSYPFHGAIERLRTAQTLDDAISHGQNIAMLSGLFNMENMSLIKTLKNAIFEGKTKTTRAFMAIDELLFAKQQLKRTMSGPRLDVLNKILDDLVKKFSNNTAGKDTMSKPLTQCENVSVIDTKTIEIMINSRPVRISEGNFIKFDRWNISFNPYNISLVPIRAIVVGFDGSFHSTDHTKSVVNRIFYWPYRDNSNCWTTSPYYRHIGLKSGTLNEYWDTIELIKCPDTSGYCTIRDILRYQDEKYHEKKAAAKK